MNVLPSQKVTAQEQIPSEVAKELTLLKGFRDLVAERFGYVLGRRLKQAEMNKATEEERKAVATLRKAISGKELEKLIENSDLDGFKASQKEIAEAQKVVVEKSKPFREKISPLSKAQKYLDVIAIPDALKELGTPLQPRFSLSEWIDQAIKAQKASKN